MIQILALREWVDPSTGKSKKSEVWFEKGLRAPDLEAIFRSPGDFIQSISPSEQYNMYYTVAECLEESGRKLAIQHHIPFDIDGIYVPENAEEGIPHFQQVARIACSAIGVPYEKCGILFSGNGLQIIVGTTFPIEDVLNFDRDKRHYKAICSRIQAALGKAGLQGKIDSSVWSPARLMRYPGTRNIKPGKPERMGIILNGVIERLPYNLAAESGIPAVEKEDQVSISVLDAFPTPDVKAIMNECQFMHWAATNPNEISEPEWYAMLSITSRFPEGRKLSHEFSKGHPGYSYEETEAKIDQAIASSGPRTCKNLDALSDKCKGCKHFGTKLISPILIEGPDHIKTQGTGFHFMKTSEGGKLVSGKPDVEGLQKFFAKQFPYVTLVGSRVAYTWNGQFYEGITEKQIKQFANTHFDPHPKSALRQEFFEEVHMHGFREPDWFQGSIRGKMNFTNGVVDVQSRETVPHTKDLGFRSVLPCEFEPKAKCPNFEKFMRDVTENRQELIDVLQEYMGYVFASEDCRYEKALVLLGGGANGKSTFVEVIRKLAGKFGSSNLSFKALSNDQDRYLLEGKLVNIAEENSEDSFRDAELIKNIVSGGYIKIKQLYAQPYEIKNTAKLVMLCNNAPRSNDHSHGFYRKLLLVPFTATFSDEKGNKDTALGEKLGKELPGIFNWVMEGYARLVKNGKFSTGPVIEQAFESYTSDVNPVHQWFTEKCALVNGESLPVNRAELYNDFRQWCQENGVRSDRYTSRKVLDYVRGKITKKFGHPVKEPRQSVEGKQVYVMYGVNLLDKPLH